MNDSDDILTALFALRDTTRLTVTECDTLTLALSRRDPPFDGVRTLGDLKVAVERGAVKDAKLAKKLGQVLA